MSDKEYPKPSLTADVVTFSLDDEGRISVLLIQRGKDPFAGRWAIPGGFCEPSETVRESAARELVEETGIRDLPMVELGVFSRPGRDPRGWVVSVAHVAILPADRRDEAKGGDDARAAKFFSIGLDERGRVTLTADGEEAGPLAFDHDEILARSIARLEASSDMLGPMLFGRPMSGEEAQRAIETALSRG
ncbi:NUDIX hydrolase [Polyangium sp. 15x6]|uniref:NUDIX hydrolase n=1 Tax=Polyangium sp. 15x6 TaxID=3042687 RepID=UPI00249CA2DF|nr:NUDIX hydrolase [Polyangium sp. 15x6]MDI3287528.1 NUDIX hydrolase [Polyangium sp. 15x6]